MILSIPELCSALQKAWAYGYARGVIRDHKSEECDVMAVLEEVFRDVRLKAKNRE